MGVSHAPLIEFLKAELKKNPKMSSTDAIRLARQNHLNADEATIQSVFVGVQNEVNIELVSKTGSALFRGNVRPDSKQIGIISSDPTGAGRFTPASGESFTYQELQKISEFVKQTINANDGTK